MGWGLRGQAGPHLSPVFVSLLTSSVPVGWTSACMMGQLTLGHQALAGPKGCPGQGCPCTHALPGQLGQQERVHMCGNGAPDLPPGGHIHACGHSPELPF